MAAKFLPVLSLAAAVAAHGVVTSPAPRAPGSAFQAACGNSMFTNQVADPLGNIQGMEQMRDASLDPADCKVELCKAFRFEDNADNVHSFTAGEIIDFEVNIGAPHTGVANVSVVDTAANAMIGTPLISFTNYASTRTGVDANNTAFSVTMPNSLSGADCATAGNCVLQWWWHSDEAGQTYMSCVDFTFDGTTGGGNDGGEDDTPAPAPAPTTTLETSIIPAPTASATAVPEPEPPVVEEPVEDGEEEPEVQPCSRRRRARRGLRANKTKRTRASRKSGRSTKRV